MPVAPNQPASAHAALSLHAALLKHLLAKGLMTAEEVGAVLNSAVELSYDHPEADAVKALIEGVAPQD